MQLTPRLGESENQTYVWNKRSLLRSTEAEKFALPLKNQPSDDSIRIASVALSPVSLSSNSEWEEIRTVRLNKEANRSLGISIVGGKSIISNLM